jgi:transcriptional regulator with XRE-family HTH domain
MHGNDVVKKILQAIAEAGYSQREFARDFGIAENLISGWKTGARKPSIASIRKVAKGTKKNLSYFLGDTIINAGDNAITGKNIQAISQKEIELLRKEIELLKRENELLKKGKSK